MGLEGEEEGEEVGADVASTTNKEQIEPKGQWEVQWSGDLYSGSRYGGTQWAESA